MAAYVIDDHFFDAPGPRADVNLARQYLIVNLLQRVCAFQDHTPKLFLQQMMRLISNGLISMDVVPGHLRQLLETMPPYIALDPSSCQPNRSSVASVQPRACTLPIEDPQLEFSKVNRFESSLVPVNETMPPLPSEVNLPFPIHMENLSIFRRDFKIERHLGQGAFGNVFHVKNNLDQQDYAVKAIQFSRGIQGRLFEQRVYRELTTWSKLNHPHIARYLHGWIEPSWELDDTFGLTSPATPEQSASHARTQSIDELSDSSQSSGDCGIDFVNSSGPEATAIVPQDLDEPDSRGKKQPRSLISKFNYGMTLYIQMELCRDVTLDAWMRSTHDTEIRGKYGAIIFWQLCHALDHMHRIHGVIHRDLKPSNVFFGRNDENQLSVRLGDFGLAKRIDEFDDGDDGLAHSHNVGTFVYSSPEQIDNMPYSFSTDIYSLGLLLVEMFTPCSTSMERACMLQDLRKLKLPNELASFPNLTRLARAMLSHDPAERPSAEEILGASGWAPSILREFHEAYDFTDASSSSFTYFNPPTPGTRPQCVTYQSPVNMPNGHTTMPTIPELCLPPARDSQESLANRSEAACQTDALSRCPHCGHEIKESDRETPSETGSDQEHQGTTSTLSDSEYGDIMLIKDLHLDEELQQSIE